MGKISYLMKRGASYYVRLKVPLDLVDTLGKRELVKALGTRDPQEAKRRVWPQIEAWHRYFDELRARREITGEDQQHAIWGHYTGTLERDEHRRAHLPTEADIEKATEAAVEFVQQEGIDVHDSRAMMRAAIDVHVLKDRRSGEKSFDARVRRAKLDALRKHLASGETALIADEVDEYLRANKLIVETGSAQWQLLARQMMQAEIEALERSLERDRGDYTGQPRNPLVQPPKGRARKLAEPGETIMEVFEQYVWENPNQVKPDTLNQAKRDIQLFAQFVGPTCSVSRIDKKAVREWKALLLRYPVKATESKPFQGMSLEQAVKHNEQVGKPVITARTVNRHLASLGAFCKWLVNHGYLDQNPVSGMALAKEKHSKTRTFDADQLNALFKSPLFAGCQSDEEWRFIRKPGSVQIRDHRFWTPLIMLFSGARPGEIAQLGVGDVRQEHGHWIMHITDEGDGQSIKTAGSTRVLPVHEELQRLGFIEYHSRMVASGHDRLFPKAKRNSRGQMIADYSREFSRYLTSIGIKQGRGYSLYSFRHGAADALRRAGYLDEQFGFILGHGSATMTGRYGQLPQGVLEQRVELISAISYPGLSLEHLGSG